MMGNILIVDDSRPARPMIRRCLEIAGFADARFREAEHGREARALLRGEKADMIPTELTMPEMDGGILIRQRKTAPRLASIPVIVISSIANDHEEETLRPRGVAAVMPKPFSPPAIMEVVRSLGSTPEGACHV